MKVAAVVVGAMAIAWMAYSFGFQRGEILRSYPEPMQTGVACREPDENGRRIPPGYNHCWLEPPSPMWAKP